MIVCNNEIVDMKEHAVDILNDENAELYDKNNFLHTRQCKL